VLRIDRLPRIGAAVSTLSPRALHFTDRAVDHSPLELSADTGSGRIRRAMHGAGVPGMVCTRNQDRAGG
jgi:hypothetical protein